MKKLSLLVTGERDAVVAGRVGPQPRRRRAATVPVLVHRHHWFADRGDTAGGIACTHLHSSLEAYDATCVGGTDDRWC